MRVAIEIVFCLLKKLLKNLLRKIIFVKHFIRYFDIADKYIRGFHIGEIFYLKPRAIPRPSIHASYHQNPLILCGAWPKIQQSSK